MSHRPMWLTGLTSLLFGDHKSSVMNAWRLASFIESFIRECGSPRAGLKQSYYTYIKIEKNKKIIIIMINDSQTYTH